MANTKTEVKFNLNFGQQKPLPEVIEWWKAADKAGMDALGFPDSPVQMPEVYICQTLAALNTEHVQLIPGVTNPMTRHPSVAASALATIETIAPGRVQLGIATGDSAIWGTGGKFSTVEHLREYIIAVKGLCRGEEVEYRGKKFKSLFGNWQKPFELPVIVACSGPKVLKMSAQVADGMFIVMGMAPENIKYVKGIIKEGCEEAGRNPDELELWWGGGITFADSVEEAMENSLGANVSWMVMGSMEGKQIPEEYKEPLRELAKGTHTFSQTYFNPNRTSDTIKRAKELGVYDWLQTRASRLGGTPDDVVKRFEEFRQMGLTNWLYTILGANVDRLDIIDKMKYIKSKLA